MAEAATKPKKAKVLSEETRKSFKSLVFRICCLPGYVTEALSGPPFIFMNQVMLVDERIINLVASKG